MTTPISTDAHFQSWMTATEDRRAASHAALIGAGAEQAEIGGTMTITTAADRSTTSRPTIYRAIKSGALLAGPLYPGGRQKIREADFRRWIENRGGNKS